MGIAFGKLSKDHHQTNLGPIKRMQITRLILSCIIIIPQSAIVFLYVGRVYKIILVITAITNHSIYRTFERQSTYTHLNMAIKR